MLLCFEFETILYKNPPLCYYFLDFESCLTLNVTQRRANTVQKATLLRLFHSPLSKLLLIEGHSTKQASKDSTCDSFGTLTRQFTVEEYRVGLIQLDCNMLTTKTSRKRQREYEDEYDEMDIDCRTQGKKLV